MEEILNNILITYGMPGLIVAGAAYTLYTSYKHHNESEMKNHQIYDDLLNNSYKELNNLARSMDNKIDKFIFKLDNIAMKVDTISRQQSDIVVRTDRSHPMYKEMESNQMDVVARTTPTINTILSHNIDKIGADHILICMFHNGVQSTTGNPFFKFDVVVEKYKPSTNPDDKAIALRYQNVNIALFGGLPDALYQEGYLIFDIEHDDTLSRYDEELYRKCKEDGIKEISFNILDNANGQHMGFVCTYTFKGSLNRWELGTTVETLQSVYNNIYN